MHDIHTHLYWDSYDTDRDVVIARAHAAGVEKMFAIGCTVEESQQCVALANRYPEIFAAVGIHPHEFKGASDTVNLPADMALLRELTTGSKRVVAIGECGLDYYVRPVTIDLRQAFVGRGSNEISAETKAAQRQGFVAQIALARELGLPLIVHCRDAYEDMLALLNEEGKTLKAIILHCYMGDTEVTKKFLELGNVYFSFTANITYPVKRALSGTKDDLTETVKIVSLERLFVETDCPFLTPQSKRGERNEPSAAREVLERVAELHGVEPSRVEKMIDVTFRRVFSEIV